MTRAIPEENTLYRSSEALHERHWEALVAKDPSEAAKTAAGLGATWDGEAYHLRVGAKTVAINPVKRSCLHTDSSGRALEGDHVSYQRGLVATSYLSHAMPADPAGRWVAFRELPGGEPFFRGPHEVDTKAVEEAFGAEPALLVRAAKELGGASSEGGEVSVELNALPLIPIKILLWGKSEEFAASAQMLVDSRAYLHLALDVLWAMSNVAVADLVSA